MTFSKVNFFKAEIESMLRISLFKVYELTPKKKWDAIRRPRIKEPSPPNVSASVRPSWTEKSMNMWPTFQRVHWNALVPLLGHERRMLGCLDFVQLYDSIVSLFLICLRLLVVSLYIDHYFELVIVVIHYAPTPKPPCTSGIV